MAVEAHTHEDRRLVMKKIQQMRASNTSDVSTMEEEEFNPRASLKHEDLEEDRRLIKKKIKQKIQKHRQLDNSARSDPDYYDPENLRNDSFDDGFEEDDDDRIDEEHVFRAVKAAHEQDEELIGGRDGQEALEAALSSPPTAWWAMRKQWQKRRSSLGFGGKGGGEGAGGDEMDAMDIQSIADHISSRRMGQASKPISTDSGVVGHPVMLTDPQSMGYTALSYRQSSNGTAPLDPKAKKLAKKKQLNRAPPMLYVSKGVVQKRKLQQIAYIVAAMCGVFLFMFFLEQRKLSHYAMVDSPMSLSAYLAGERMTANNQEDGDNMVSFGLGDRHFRPEDDQAGVINSLVPGMQEQRTIDAQDFTGSSLVHGSDRFKILQDMIVGNGITLNDEFQNELSPQYQALHWMAYNDGFQPSPNDPLSIQKIIQRYALAVTYYATGGPNWTEQLGFLSNDDECTWNNEMNGYFLGSGRCGDDGLIITLALWGNNLVGFLPNEVGALMTLRELSFFDNAIRGPPPRTLHNLPSLGVLYLHKNQFQGDLNFMCDRTIGHFKSDCGKQGGVLCECCTHCGFQSVPDVQASPQYETSPQVVKSPQADASNAHADRFHRLKTLFISSGVTPEEKFVDLTSPQYRALEWMASQDATHLAAHDSNVTKKLIQRYALAVVFFATSGPTWTNDFNFLSDTDECSWGKKINGHLAGVGKCKAGFITVMHLKGNNLGGFLPDEIGALTSLIRVSFFDNSISGKFPTSLQALTSLEKVQLQGNHFQGSLDFLCDNKIDEFISDCGDKGNVECSCCSTCGFKAKI